jgi:hypothetical protein
MQATPNHGSAWKLNVTSLTPVEKGIAASLLSTWAMMEDAGEADFLIDLTKMGSSRQRYVKCHRKLRLTLVLLSFQAFRTPRFEGKNTALISGAELKYVEDGNGLLT